jgi:leader peptidase (prepilin peptidase)/N-methyltransferase
MGFRQLQEPDAPRWSLVIAAILGTGGGAAAVVRDQPDGYLPLAVLILWSVGLAACAACDWVTHRIPTSLVRRAGIVAAGLLLITSGADERWRPTIVAGIACAASFGIGMAGRRFAGLGRGDVRLAALGGLGLGWSSARSLVLGAAALCLVSLVQAIVVLVRGGDRHSAIAYGVPLAVGYLVASAAV